MNGGAAAGHRGGDLLHYDSDLPTPSRTTLPLQPERRLMMRSIWRDRSVWHSGLLPLIPGAARSSFRRNECR